MKTNALLSMSLNLTLAALAACGPINPKLFAPPESLKAVSIKAGQLNFDAQSKVDILIVVDNSLSMKDHQISLAKEMDQFVDQFAKNGLIDFHIGVVPVYDTRAVAAGRKIHPAGQLLPMKLTTEGTLFGTPETPNLKEALKATIKIGITRGPEWEESFSPVLAMMTPEVNQMNQGFYRADAHLAIIFITDADDAGTDSIAGTDTAGAFYKKLLEAKGNEERKILISGALPLEDSCVHDDDLIRFDAKGNKIAMLQPVKMIALLDSVKEAQKVSLCSKTLGTQLADFGDKLSERVGRKILTLPEEPDKSTLKVKYGTQEIEENYETGYSYFPSQQKIELSGKMKLEHEDGAQVTVDYIGINESNRRNGNVRVIGN